MEYRWVRRTPILVAVISAVAVIIAAWISKPSDPSKFQQATKGSNNQAIRDRNNLGLAYHAKGEVDRAIRYFEQALAVFERRLGNEHPHTKSVRANIAAMGR